ncbi:endonuclease V [Planctomicrobium piriforme]|uniref:endonuclease V n=1 Tax=Planctomicrobium piriforme TaxID=1576369 RepID=UPI001587D2F8|nr:endonuclease V [Planctomicrobium piriforme]
MNTTLPVLSLSELQAAIPDLPAEVRGLLVQIPPGQVTTYGDLARALGDDKARAARWLGDFLAHHEHSADCVCYRVVRANGEIGLSVEGPEQKVRHLKAEGVTVDDLGRVDLSQRFTDFQSSRPLSQLKENQLRLASAFCEEPLSAAPRTLGAVDVAYTADGIACAAYVALDASSLEIVTEQALKRPVAFPYIPGYLTWRELPVILELCEQVRQSGQLADVIFCDGNGRLHPWRAGIAVCLGAMLAHPVIGVGKSLLCGKVNQSELQSTGEAAVIDSGETIGHALGQSGASMTIYVSAGNRITLPEAVELSRQAIQTHRLPEPIFLADRLTKRLKQSPPT